MMDTVFIHNLTTKVQIGVNTDEQNRRQPVMINLEFGVNAAAAARSDRLEDTVDYDKLSQFVLTFVQATSCGLIETLAQKLADELLRVFSLPWVRIELHKPEALENTSHLGVRIERHAKN